MRALLFRPGAGAPAIESIEIDSPCEREVLIRVVACGLCHSDLHFMESRNQTGRIGLYGRGLDECMQPGPAQRRREEAEAPMLVMGHEPAGVVEAVGRDVKSLRPGDRVVGAGISHCGVCRSCVSGSPALCLTLPRRGPDDKPRLSQRGQRVTQFANLGGFAEQLLAHETSLVKIGEDISFESAAILGCSIATGVGAALNTARVRPGSTVAVFGCGGIGLSVIQGARIAGAARIFAVDILSLKLTLARELGATDGIDASKVDSVQTLLELTGGAGVDYSFETTAVQAVAQAAFGCLGLRGCLTCLAGTPADLGGLVWSERRVIGSMLGSSRLAVDIPRYVELYRRGILKLDEMVSLTVPLEQFGSAARALEEGSVARAVLRVQAG